MTRPIFRRQVPPQRRKA